MIKVKVSEIVNSIEQLKALQEIKFPVKVSYKINRLVNKLNPELITYNESRNKIINELGEKDEETGNIQVKDPEKMKLFGEKLMEILSVEIELDWFEKIKISELGDIAVEPKNLVEFVFEE